MDKKKQFEQNLHILLRNNPSCSRLLSAKTTLNRYKFFEARSGKIVPALADSSGQVRPLHSLVDPEREAGRLIDLIKDSGFFILLGLGGGFYAKAALEKENAALILVIDYDANSIAELLSSVEYEKIFSDPRFYFLVCPDKGEIEHCILNIYQPLLCGGIHTLPLRARTVQDTGSFENARLEIENAVRKITADYSVQAYFGTRWFSNIIRNLKKAEENQDPLPSVRRAAVTAAGPSLDIQMPYIQKKRKDFFLIATDTSLPALLSAHIIPDAVTAIDCQHISYYHFMAGLPGETMLFMDLAGPPLAASCSENTRFFSGNHPLTAYIRRSWRPLPEVDTSGGNVTFASIALAEKLGAASVELFGADFSYPLGQSYVRGAYIHPLFEYRQNRLMPLEGQHSAFLYRGPLQKKISTSGWYYESPSLTFYRERLEKKCNSMEMRVIPAEGLGAPIQCYPINKKPQSGTDTVFFNTEEKQVSAREFLLNYRHEISALKISSKDIAGVSRFLRAESILTTLLPAAAAIKRRRPELASGELIEETRSYCLKEIERVLNAWSV